jgi:hypothetical protein
MKTYFVLKQAPCHEDVRGNRGTAPRNLTSSIDGGEWSDSRPGCFIPEETAPGTYWIGSWGEGPRAGMVFPARSLVIS